MYSYPFPSDNNYFLPFATSPDLHSMGNSLLPYLKMKINSFIDFKKINQIKVLGCFDRESGISANEKDGKQFNFMRPTVQIIGQNAEIRCFPGIDYIFHYSNIYSTFSNLYENHIDIISEIPTEEQCWNEICSSSLCNIPKVDTVVMGYVEGLDFLSSDRVWNGKGNFLYKRIKIKSGDAILLGCKHTYWGEIAGRIVTFLSLLDVKKIIYSGKLGTLNASFAPNEIIATGNASLLPNGEIITWENMFETASNENIRRGRHVTIPSVLQETIQWVKNKNQEYSFVDPEIGHMAYAAQIAKIKFSYLHVVSDNLSNKYSFDLSNERKNVVKDKRKNLMRIIGQEITKL